MVNSDGVLVPPPGMKGNPSRAQRGKAFSFADLADPLPQEIKDTREVQKMHREWNLVPYAGRVDASGDALRAFLASMTYLSPAHGACIASKKLVSLGKMTVRRRVDQDFVFGANDEVTPAQGRAVLDYIRGVGTGGKSLKDLAQALYEDWETTGDQFLEIVVATTLGVKTYSVFRHSPENCKYLATAKGEQRFVAISPIWKDAYLRKNPPDVVPLFPAFSEQDGIQRSILHRLNGKNEWYGRPPAFPSWMFQYREFQDASYMVKISNNNFTGQVIIEAEDDNPEQTDEDARNAGFSNEADRIAKNFTAQADDPMTVWYSTRPHGSRPMFVHEVRPNTSQEFYKVMDEMSEKKIIRSHQWSKRLMEADDATGISTNVFMDALKSRLPVIAGVQENAVALLNRAIAAIVTLDGRREFEGLGVAFVSPYQEIIDQTKQEQP